MTKAILSLVLLVFFVGITNAEFFQQDWPSVNDLAELSTAVRSYVLTEAPRRDFAGQPVSPQFCGWDEERQECRYLEYAESIGVLMVAGPVIAILSVLVLFVFCLVRACGCCYDKSKAAPPRQLIMLKIAIIINVILIGVVLIVAFVGNSKISTGAINSTNGVLDFSSLLGEVLSNVSSEVTNFNISIDIAGTLSAIQDLQGRGKDIQTEFIKYENIRKSVFIAGYVLLILMCLLALISCFVWLCFSGHINCCCGIFMLIFMWVIFTLGIGLGTVATDVCMTLDNQRNAQSTGVTVNGILGTFLGEYGRNCTAFEVLKNDAYGSYYSTADELCSQYNDFCTDPNAAQYIISCGPCNRNITFENLKNQTIINNRMVCPEAGCPTGFCSGQPDGTTCRQSNVTLDRCPTECYRDELKDKTGQLIGYLGILDGIKRILDYLSPYLGCQTISLFIDYVYDPLCVEFVDGISMLFIASAIIGLLLVAFVVQALMAIHVFDPSLDAIYPEEEEAYSGSGDPAAFAQQRKLKRNMSTATIGFFSNKTFALETSPSAASGQSGFRVSQISRHSSVMSMKDMGGKKNDGVKDVKVAAKPAEPESESESESSSDTPPSYNPDASSRRQSEAPRLSNAHRESSNPPPTNPELD